MVQIEELRAAFATRLKKALAENHVEPWGAGVRLSKMTGVTPKAASKWLNGEAIPGPAKMRALSEALNTPLGWLQNGAEGLPVSGHPVSIELSNVSEVEQSSRMYRYPVVSSVAAGAWAEAVEPHPNGFSDRYEVSDYKAKGKAFWLEVVGDSMTAPAGTSVPEGMLILVDTGVEARPGKLVVAKLPSSNDATFKKLIDDAGQLYLKPLNPGYSMIKCTDDCKIIGVAVRVTGFL
ncbi:LexA family protein [Pseudomonas syringae]|uniref:Repressor protein c2 n=1 Tax=Pseudomonas syringae pv. aceris TaxID=199198 RepID=A0A0L8ISM2_PSESX|nr:S24 family peptidase [Pseudomonas syringae]EGH74606.1 repressor protein c2 [Pseudomonas syringae pv. aceris str. M302273]KOG04460.1 Repressor protein c2 [Pseudomonas syringae pv. aceris]KPW21495.1 Repressor protein c2 [Pseudomonas syringae pv. aceris]